MVAPHLHGVQVPLTPFPISQHVFVLKGTSQTKVTAAVVALRGHITGRGGSGRIGGFLGRLFKGPHQVGAQRALQGPRPSQELHV